MGDADGCIEFSLQEDKNKGIVSITIADNGIGIKQDDLPYVFIRFFQSRHLPKNIKGTGIGLYLVRKFAELHNGTVYIFSSGEGKGTTVIITLPLEGENLLPSLHEETANELKLLEQETRPTLLIIDDNIEIISFMIQSFSPNYRCLKATNGKKGFAIASEQKPDLIIVDQMMPEMDGLEFCRSLRRFQSTNSIPVIMLTAKDDTDTEMKSIKAGVDVFMAKPFDLNRLMLRMTQLLQARKSLEKNLRIETITRPTEIVETESADEMLLERLTKTIEDRMEDTSFNVTMLSDISGVDAKQLYRKLKQLTGYTPVCYIRQIRMKKAAMLLSQNKFSISEVMYMVGYTNASYFSKCFVAEFGVTPSQFVTK
jgi:DNA-binding response OmpR family regulator